MPKTFTIKDIYIIQLSTLAYRCLHSCCIPVTLKNNYSTAL